MESFKFIFQNLRLIINTEMKISVFVCENFKENWQRKSFKE